MLLDAFLHVGSTEPNDDIICLPLVVRVGFLSGDPCLHLMVIDHVVLFLYVVIRVLLARRFDGWIIKVNLLLGFNSENDVVGVIGDAFGYLR